MTRTDLEAPHPIDLHLDIRALMQDAMAMADRADALALAGFFSHFEVTTKEDGTDVTSVDRQIELELRDMIGRGGTAAGVLGEEYGETIAGPEGVGRWVLDPIDGTAAFIDADPRFATLIAFESEGRPLVGVVSAPALGLRWWAGIGHGAFLSRDGAVSAARVSITDDPSAARGLVPDSWMNGPGAGEWPRSPDTLAADAMAAIRWSGFDASWQAVRVAGGDYDVSVTAGAWWDVAPLPVIVTEAGGVVRTDRRPDGSVAMVLSNSRIAPHLHGIDVRSGRGDRFEDDDRRLS